jgi:hypothetical protein
LIQALPLPSNKLWGAVERSISAGGTGKDARGATRTVSSRHDFIETQFHRDMMMTEQHDGGSQA